MVGVTLAFLASKKMQEKRSCSTLTEVLICGVKGCDYELPFDDDYGHRIIQHGKYHRFQLWKDGGKRNNIFGICNWRIKKDDI